MWFSQLIRLFCLFLLSSLPALSYWWLFTKNLTVLIAEMWTPDTVLMNVNLTRQKAGSLCFFSGSGCSSGSPVIARPLVSDPGLPSGFTSNRPWAGRWTPKLLLTSSCYGAISVRMCVWTWRDSVGPNSTFTIYCTLALNSCVSTLLFTSFALLIQRFSCTLHL